MPERGPSRPPTPQQMRIADGIERGLSYKEIGVEMQISASTVRTQVMLMAYTFDAYHEWRERYTPREIIWKWMAYCRWAREHATTLPTPA